MRFRRTRVRQQRERVVGDLSTSPVSSRSPRQMVSASCSRTAGVGSTGTSASSFLSSSVASVASRCVASVELRERQFGLRQSRQSALRTRELCRGVGVVESLDGGVARRSAPSGQGELRSVASRSVASSAVAYLGRLLRRSSPSISSHRVEVASCGVELRSSRSSVRPRSVLRVAFERLAKSARREVAQRLSGRFAPQSVFKSSELSRVAFKGSDSVASSVLSSVASEPLRCVPPARTWRLH
jgi:hypothetical protein